MKVLLISSLYPPNIIGGAEKVVARLAGALTDDGHQVAVITTQPHGDPCTRTIDGVRVFYLPSWNIYRHFANVKAGAARKALWHLLDVRNPLMGREVSRILEAEKPDIVNSHNISALSGSVWSATRKHRLPIVHTLHDQYLICPRATMFRNDKNCAQQCFDCRLYASARKLATQQVDVCTGVSRFILERHLSYGYFPRAEKRVIYNGVVHSESIPDERTQTKQTFRFGYLGQVRATKGLHLLIDAFKSEFSAEAELLIAGRGDPDYERALRQQTEGNSAIRWLGFVEPDELFRSIDVLVVPSIWHDTAPLVLLEAFNRSIPVLASNRGGIPEFVPNDTGWIFDPDDLASFRRSLRRCVELRQHLPKMGKIAREFARTFTPSAFLGGYLDAYHHALRIA